MINSEEVFLSRHLREQRRDGEIMDQWLTERVLFTPESSTYMVDLYHDYIVWFKQTNSLRLITPKKTFASNLKCFLNRKVELNEVKFSYKPQSTVHGLKLVYSGPKVEDIKSKKIQLQANI